MAKELPFWKFEPNQWENGNIQMCSREEKGLFIDLCSMYWSRLGDVPLKLAVQKLCGGNATALDSLIQSHIFRVIDGNIFIEFLSEQLQDFENTSEINRNNALEGWKKRRQNKALSENYATASNPQCENDAIREEKRREEKRKKLTPKGVCDLPPEKSPKPQVETIDFKGLLDFYNNEFNRRCTVINEKTRSKYKARIKEGYTKDQIVLAMKNAKKVQSHIDNNFTYLTPEFFSRSETLDKYGTLDFIQNKPKHHVR